MRQIVCSALTALVVAGAAAAANAPDVQERIVPGQSIGKIELGMTLAQVKRVLGPPESVIERERRAFGGDWIEYSWNFTEWRIGFVLEDGVQRAVAIRSRVRTERTREGVGVGVAAARVPRTYGVRCVDAFLPDRPSMIPGLEPPSVGYWCVLPHRGGTRTAFVLGSRCVKRERYMRCARWVAEVEEAAVFAAGEPLPVTLRHSRVWKP